MEDLAILLKLAPSENDLGSDGCDPFLFGQLGCFGALSRKTADADLSIALSPLNVGLASSIASALALNPFSSFGDPIEEVASTPLLEILLPSATLERRFRSVVLISFRCEPSEDEAFSSRLGGSLTLLLWLAFSRHSFSLLPSGVAQVVDLRTVGGESKLLFLSRAITARLGFFKSC